MININGQNWNSYMFTSGVNINNIGKETYGSRSCIAMTTGTSATGISEVSPVKYLLGACTASDATRPRANRIRVRFAEKAMSLAAGSSKDVFLAVYLNSDSISNSLQVKIQVYNDAGTYKVRLVTIGNNGSPETLLLGTIVAGTTFHTVDLYAMLDATRANYDGAYVNTITYATELTLPMYLAYIQMDFDSTVSDAKFDAIYLSNEEVDFTATALRFTQNLGPANGYLYLIESAALAALIVAGTAYKLAVTDGAVTESATVDKYYLAAFIPMENDGGDGLTLNQSAGGDWTRAALP